MNVLPITWVEAEDISNAVLFLASDEARYITGVRCRRRGGPQVKNGADWPPPKQICHEREQHMPGRVAGKVAFITGAARGQGRSHAIRLAQEGADIIAVDICGQIGSVPYPWPPRRTWPRRSRRWRRSTGGSWPARRTCGTTALKAALDDGVAQLGHLDIVSANAGIFSFGTLRGAGRHELAGHDRHQPDRRLAHRQGGASRTCARAAAGRSS